MSLWNDTFAIEISHTNNNFHGETTVIQDKFTGSLKGAIYYFFDKYSKEKGYFVATFYNSKGEWLKEIGI